MIVLVTHTETDSRGRTQTIASHGIDLETGRNVVVQQNEPRKLGAIFHQDMGEWVIMNDRSSGETRP